jgi:hypothetical protein
MDCKINNIDSTSTSPTLNPTNVELYLVQSSPSPIDFEIYQPQFGWTSTDIIKHTFDNTTQYAKSLHLYSDMRKHFESRFPAFNVIHRNKPVAIGDGSKCAQLFVGRHSLVADVYGMKTNREFVNTLEHNIRKCGVMLKIVSDHALPGISSKIQHILNTYIIDDWQS